MRILRGELVRIKTLIRPFVVKKYLQATQEPKLHLGCGSKRFPGWLNADRFKADADIYLNACRRYPFADNTFRAVYTEHMLEHIPVDYVPGLLSEVHRILQPGGMFRVTVPDLDIYVEKYTAQDRAFFEPILVNYREKMKDQKKKYWLVRTPGGAFMSRAVHRCYHHHWMYDFQTLKSCLEEIGFKTVLKQQFNQSVLPEAGLLDRPDRQFETLYVDAIK